MFNFKKTYYTLGAATTVGIMTSSSAHAANNFGSIAENVTLSIASVPGLLTALAYMFGVLLGTLGVMKIKDHVENPSQTPLKDGAIRLAAGGALFTLPIIFEAMRETVADGGAAGTTTATLVKKVTFNVN